MGRLAAAFALLFLVNTGPAHADSFEEGLRAFRSGQADVARDIWLPLAEAGDAAAQYSLGKLFEQGEHPVPKDLAQAVRWYREAAAQRLPAAQNNLALMYAKGRGLPVDLDRAVELWTSAAAQNYPWAQYNLGLAYFRGQGVAIDQREAAAWFRRAADGGLGQAQFIMGQLKREGLTLRQDSGVALTWYQRAAENGDARARREAKALEAAGVEPKPPGEPELNPGRQPAKAPVSEGQSGKAPLTLYNAEGPVVLDKAAPAPRAPTTEPAAPDASPQAAHSVGAPRALLSEAANGAPVAESPSEPEAIRPGTGEPAIEAAALKALASEASAAEPAARDEPAAAPAPAATKAPSPAPQARQTATLPAPATPTQTPGFSVWLGSEVDPGKAAALWEETRTRHADIFAATAADFAKVDLGDGQALYRILAGPVASEADAQAICRRLRAAQPGAFCKVQSK